MRCDIQMWQNLQVPLLGLWGAISYAPAMVRRHIGSKQFITSGGGINEKNEKEGPCIHGT